ncbi:MAG: Sec23/Sec24 zinc finger-containing protein [archaeon]|nr:Sec23/Sec24 zinc finger-containing protein [archaeon]
MLDILKEESQNGIRMSWNCLPTSMIDYQRYIVPCGMHYTPLKKTENLQILEYDPLLCKNCKSVLAPTFNIDFRSKSWHCPFCDTNNMFPTIYANNISEENLPAELQEESSTIEYKLSKKESSLPVIFFLIDVSVDESELQELKDSIQSALTTIPNDCSIGIILFGTMCSVVELGFSEAPKMFIFKGDKTYTPNEIAQQLGLVNKNDPRVQTQLGKKFIVPLKDYEFSINSFLDDLFPDPFPQGHAERRSNCAGLALNVAITLLESVHNGEPSRILLFSGGPCNIGDGKIVDIKLTETIRNYLDFEKGNENTYHFKNAIKYYEELADRAFKANQIIDIYSCCLNQIGLLEMKFLVERTGGIMLLTDSFSTIPFKDTFSKLMDVDEDGNLKMCFKGKTDIFMTKPLKLKGALGHLVSLQQQTMGSSNINIVSKNEIGEGRTRSWNLGGIDDNSTYTYIFDVDQSSNTNNTPRYVTIQIQTSYIAGDRTTRLRVTTIRRKLIPDFENGKYEIGQSFDQEAALVLIAKLAINRMNREDRMDVLRWVDKTLILVANKFGQYTPEDTKSFKLTKEFAYFPQFIFYLRRSYVLQFFNASPDEITHFKTTLLRETVENCTIMIQPSLISYTSEEPEGNPVFLEVDNMKRDCVLMLDAFFYICIWQGEDVCYWKNQGYAEDPEYENIKIMLESPEEAAQNIISERMPTPRFVKAEYGSGQERLIKSALDPNISGTGEMKEGYFVSDDVSLKVFMEHLIRKAVSS